MKSFRLIFLFLLLNTAIFNVQAQTVEPSSDAKLSDFKKIILQLNWKYQFEFAGYIAAKEKGYYREAGLDVELSSNLD